MPLTENHIKQLHGTLLRFTPRDEYHRGSYKTTPNNVEAFDERGRSVGVIFETASPFDTPRLMQELTAWQFHGFPPFRNFSDATYSPLIPAARFTPAATLGCPISATPALGPPTNRPSMDARVTGW